MELIRDLLRDFVGVLFPGGLLVIFTLWFIFSIMIFFIPADSFNSLASFNNFVTFSILLVFSYIAGQFLRLKQLIDLEKKCTEEYRKQRIEDSKKEGKSELSQSEFKKSTDNIDELEKKYFSGDLNIEKLKEEYINHNNRFGIWEEFPYPYELRGRRLLHQSKEYSKFFEKYDEQGILKYRTFFNFCKTVIFEYSPPLKEEALRQESLIRLLSGVYYAIKYGKIINIIIGILHLVLIAAYILKIDFLSYRNIEYSCGIFVISLLALFIFWYMNTEIIRRLRFMRIKELNLVYGGFYIICKKHNFDI